MRNRLFLLCVIEEKCTVEKEREKESQRKWKMYCEVWRFSVFLFWLLFYVQLGWEQRCVYYYACISRMELKGVKSRFFLYQNGETLILKDSRKMLLCLTPFIDFNSPPYYNGSQTPSPLITFPLPCIKSLFKISGLILSNIRTTFLSMDILYIRPHILMIDSGYIRERIEDERSTKWRGEGASKGAPLLKNK